MGIISSSCRKAGRLTGGLRSRLLDGMLCAGPCPSSCGVSAWVCVGTGAVEGRSGTTSARASSGRNTLVNGVQAPKRRWFLRSLLQCLTDVCLLDCKLPRRAISSVQFFSTIRMLSLHLATRHDLQRVGERGLLISFEGAHEAYEKVVRRESSFVGHPPS